MRIHITYTGGTIGMVESPNGLVPGADMRGWLRRLIEDAHLDPSLFSFTELDPLIDSSNATPDNWQTMADDLRAHRDDADAFVVLHGTDTMSYSSAALSYALTGFGKPVIFTGSQHPLGKIESDATANVTGALNAAMSGRFHGVGLFFGHHLFAGNRVSKSSSWAFEGFSAPSTGPLARTGTPWHWYAGDSAGSGCGWTSPLPYSRHDVAVIDMAPGISAARLAAMLEPRPEAVLLRAYGVGNVPSGNIVKLHNVRMSLVHYPALISIYMLHNKSAHILLDILRHIITIKHYNHLLPVKQHIISIFEIYSCELFPFVSIY